MLEVLFTLERTRHALRRQLQQMGVLSECSYLGLAIVVIGLSIFPPVTLLALPVVLPVALFMGIVGLLFIITIIGAPAGLFLL